MNLLYIKFSFYTIDMKLYRDKDRDCLEIYMRIAYTDM